MDMDIERDEVIERAVESLAVLPPRDVHAAARVMAAVRAHKAQRPSRLSLVMEWVRQPSLSIASAGMLAAAALVLGFFSRGSFRTVGEDEGARTLSKGQPTGEYPVAGSALIPASNNTESRAVPVPILFEARNAKSVVIVGDFNGWDATKTPMTRFGKDGPWTATLLAKPGRHIYAFLVDGTTLVADPRAPRARDLDYGGDASVLMVTPP
jgi:hypothetical protein